LPAASRTMVTGRPSCSAVSTRTGLPSPGGGLVETDIAVTVRVLRACRKVCGEWMLVLVLRSELWSIGVVGEILNYCLTGAPESDSASSSARCSFR
jgi:hypothetical protein